MAEIVTRSQSVEINQVSDLVVTAIAHDDIAGDYYRDITFFGEAGEGELTIPTVMTIRIRAATVDPLKISVPADEF
jgi:hypothetical protein